MINLTGVQSLNQSKEGDAIYGSRLLVHFDIDIDKKIYKWQAYIPGNVSIQEYLDANEVVYAKQITDKEKEWELSPKTKTITNEDNKEITVDMAIDEIVKPDIPDYIEDRKTAYPPITEYLDAKVKQSSIDPAVVEEGELQETEYCVKAAAVKVSILKK